MHKILFVLISLSITNPAIADIARIYDNIYPKHLRLPFYIFIIVLGLIMFISIKIELKKIKEESIENKNQE